MAPGADQRSGERRAEGRRRLAGIERAMAAEGLDALIVHGTTGCGVAMNGNYAWVSGHVPIYAASLALFRRERAPILFVPGENQHIEAQDTAWIDDVRLAPQPVRDLLAEFTAAGAPKGRIGLSSLANVPANGAEAIRGALGTAQLVEAAPAIFALRSVKSAYEQAILKRATEIADEGLARSLAMLKAGVTEFAWKAEMERVMTEAGADGGFNMLSAGRPEPGPDGFHGYVISPTARAIAAGDLALLEISPRVDGYYTQIVRLVAFGPVPDEIARAHEASVRARDAAYGALVPGAPLADVARAIDASLKSDGQAMKDVAGAHTIGLDLSETIITLSAKGEVAEGMVVTVHPMVALTHHRQMFVGETVLIGPSGPVRIGETRDEIAVIGAKRPARRRKAS